MTAKPENPPAFPVLRSFHNPVDDFPRSIPWSFAEAFRKQAMENHGQTLEGLARRGGLSVEEIWFCAKGLRWDRKTRQPIDKCAAEVRAMLSERSKNDGK